MKVALSRTHIIGFGTLALVSAWAPSVIAATAEERAKCEDMMKQMGTAAPHEHAADKVRALVQ